MICADAKSRYRIPVYILNALYLAPLTLWTYWNYGRPSKPEPKPLSHGPRHESNAETDDASRKRSLGSNSDGNANASCPPHPDQDAADEAQRNSSHHACHESSERPMFATVTVGVCHCGAGCLLGDIVGEWLVYGTGARINGRSIWAEWLIGACGNISPAVVAH